jgi:hemerythrin-like domain-containing protein
MREGHELNPVEELRAEHGAIMKVFSILQGISGKMKGNDLQVLDAFGRVLEFLKVFVDQCHHAKEEEILFPAMKEAQTRSRDLIQELISEHEQGRNMIRAMEAALSEISRKEKETLSVLAGTIEEYLPLFRTHIRKENALLFPEARELLPENLQTLIALEFRKIEDERIGTGRHEAFHSMIEELMGPGAGRH